MFFFIILLILAVLFAKEIRFIIGLFLLYGISLALWEYWWGKIIVTVLLLIWIAALIGTAIKKIKSVIHWFKKEKDNENDQYEHKEDLDDEIREKAYLLAMEYWYKQNGNEANYEIQRYRNWRNDPTSVPDIEDWYQQNKHSF